MLDDDAPGSVVFPEEPDASYPMPHYLNQVNVSSWNLDFATDFTKEDAQDMLAYIYQESHEPATEWYDTRNLSPTSTKEEKPNYVQFIGPLGFISLDRVKATFEHSTQLATNWLKLPL